MNLNSLLEQVCEPWVITSFIKARAQVWDCDNDPSTVHDQLGCLQVRLRRSFESVPNDCKVTQARSLFG